MAHGILNSLKLRRDLRRGIDRFAKKILHESAFRFPLFCPLVQGLRFFFCFKILVNFNNFSKTPLLACRNLSWREMEASGMVSAGKWFSNTLRHFLWALLGGSALLGGMSIYRIKNDLTEKKVINYSAEVREEFSQMFKTLGLVVGASFLFFNNGLLRRYTYPLLNRVAQSNTNIGILAPLVESNIWKGIITMGGCYYYLMGSNNQFKVTSALSLSKK